MVWWACCRYCSELGRERGCELFGDGVELGVAGSAERQPWGVGGDGSVWVRRDGVACITGVDHVDDREFDGESARELGAGANGAAGKVMARESGASWGVVVCGAWIG